MDNQETLVTLPSNYTKRVEQIINEYNSTGRGLVHGFQKDAIQNSVGARQTSSWNGWRCSIDLIENRCGKFLCITDSGTAGLTGPNLEIEEIARMCDANENFPEDWRLARISCNNVSGNLSIGAGLFGIGKTLYSAASKPSVCKYYFESLTAGFGYRCNVNDKNKSRSEGAYEGEKGKDYIRSKTGLEPIDHIGTRIIICDPKEEIIESINNGEMKRAIQETWWRIIPFHSDPSTGIFLKKEKIKIPDQYLDSNYDSNFFYEDDTSVNVLPDFNLRTKKVGFFICKELDEDLRGFYFYRRGMKIGQINLNDIVPKSISDRYFGYIEVQPQWEQELVSLENITHYDIQATKKNNKAYSELRHYVIKLVTEKLKEWGFIKDRESQDKILHSWLSEIQNDIQNLFHKKGFENLGKGDSKSLYSVQWEGLTFPNPDERRTVYDGDIISFGFLVKNNYAIKKKYVAEIKVVSPNGFSNIVIPPFQFEVGPQSIYRSNTLEIDINETNAEKYSDNKIILDVRPTSGQPIPPKSQIFYYAIETRKNPQKDFELIMSNRIMPKVNDKRVNTGEAVREIVYTCTSNIEVPTSVRLAVSTHNLESNAMLIEKVFKEDFVLKPFEERESTPFNIEFNETTYENMLKKGKIEIRARLIANDSNGSYEKGEILKEYRFTVFFNMNEKRGIEDSFKIHAPILPDDPRRSWSEGHVGDWQIYVNIGHPEYLSCQDDDSRKMFVEKQVIQEFVILYLKENKYDQIGLPNDPDGSRSNHIEVLISLNKTIDEMWWEKCRQKNT